MKPGILLVGSGVGDEGAEVVGGSIFGDVARDVEFRRQFAADQIY